ncbi:carbohydrate kinase [Oceanobacillus sp. CAU 1775]
MRDAEKTPLNKNEKKLYELIKQDPFISQQALADEMNLSRPSVANMISAMVQKGYILGKAYILNEGQQVICIGGANVDRKFYLKDSIQMETSNPIRSEQSAGGVARNIAENIGRLGLDTTLLTAAGKDPDWTFIEEVSAPYMNLDQVNQFLNESTGSYTAVIDDAGDLVVALADMDVFEKISSEYMMSKVNLLTQAKMIIADLNCPKETLEQLVIYAKHHQVPLAFITVSTPKMKHMPENLESLSWLITNVDETEAFFKGTIATEEDWKTAVQDWLDMGIENVIITNGSEGAMVGNNEEGIHHVPAVKADKVIDVTGAGDAFSSAVLFSWLNNKRLTEIAHIGAVHAAKTIASPYTVRQDLSATQLQKDMEETK